MNSNRFNTSEQEVLDEILQEIRKIKEHTTADDVIGYLQEKYGIERSTRNFYLYKNVPVRISNSNSLLAIQISFEDREFLYCYNKSC